MIPRSEGELEVLVLAPFGRDAEVAAEILGRENITSRALKTLPQLHERLAHPVGVLLIAEEALTLETAQELKNILSTQKAWSNLPIVLMTSHKERYVTTESILELFGTTASVSLLERPFHIVTLLASVRVALQARQKQYQLRDLLAEKEKAVERQTAAVQQRDDFLSIASHELKTPITSMKLQVQIRKRYLQKGDPSVFEPTKVKALIDFTETQLERLARLVDDMLDISRIVNGKLSLNRQPMELGALVEEVLSGFSAQFQSAGCEVELKVSGRVFGFWDRYRIEQVVANLFTNAIKYGPGKPVCIDVGWKGPKAYLSVRDCGMGIAPENQERIFDRFERAVSGGGISGLGLGLFISRQILDLHEGTISVESKVGVGSTFTVELPGTNEQEGCVGAG